MDWWAIAGTAAALALGFAVYYVGCLRVTPTCSVTVRAGDCRLDENLAAHTVPLSPFWQRQRLVRVREDLDVPHSHWQQLLEQFDDPWPRLRSPRRATSIRPLPVPNGGINLKAVYHASKRFALQSGITERIEKFFGMTAFGMGAELYPLLSIGEARAMRLVCQRFKVAVDRRVWRVRNT